ncbi:ABC transporter permease subunit [Bacillus sp. DTU_2020_1000418_1_SI_GHA_SEK_038]|uniref:ABC transporter permease n=1 Tax=Bacillus sp. DTU_2020_1000418_1_SI_GHA_SEK_038 TaxID=3077585 RepID=UPI0028E8FF57|nr:ABC transporter permease subunit [Bacillus sp. DTU_2020_1000418_1_SI_GHA_SEK_038]WNS73856.1 ABC transporter permease subunit [Bacillus sp. DTU_2020_1000418_1_SI_GHA_SEK_038]
MSQWLTLFNKEMVEMSRNFKWVWVPLVFILLSVKEPLTLYYMPQILDAVGGLPEGAVIQLPVPSASEVMVAILSQFNTLGVLIIALTSMGIIAGERKSGVAGLILVKPVSYTSFITAKWAGALLLLWASYFAGYLASWYYVVILFEAVPFADFIQSFLLNGIWLSFVLTVTFLFNTIFKSPGAVGFVSLTAIILLSIINSIFANWLDWSPVQLPAYTSQLLFYGGAPKETLPALIVSIVSIFIMLAGSIHIFRKKELA